MPGSIIWTVGYVGSHGSHLFTGSDENPPVAVKDANGVLHFGANGLSYARWNPALAVINALQTNGKSAYHSLQTNAVHRFSKNFQAQVAYTWGHSIDDGLRRADSKPAAADVRILTTLLPNAATARLISGRHWRERRLSLLPFHGNKFVEGWQLSGILSKTTGPPLIIATGIDQALTGRRATSVLT